MASQSSPSMAARDNRRALIFVALGVIALLVVAGLAGGLIYWKFSGQNMAGLQGTWRNPKNPKHTYEFKPNGEVDTWSGSKSWWNRIGWTATWRRDGQNITIQTDRNWDLKGTLEGNSIRGKMIMRDGAGETETEIDVVWERD